MAAVSGIGDDALQANADLLGDFRHYLRQCMAVIRVARQSRDMGHELAPPLQRSIGVVTETLTPNSSKPSAATTTQSGLIHHSANHGQDATSDRDIKAGTLHRLSSHHAGYHPGSR